MKNPDIKVRAYHFSLETIKYCENLKFTYATRTIRNQLIRSSTSIGVNIVESKYSQSKKDFKNFRTYSLKSANET